MDNITITYDQGQKFTAARGLSLAEIAALMPKRDPHPLAAIVNGVLQELDYHLHIDSEIIWLDYRSGSGYRIYKRGLLFLLLVALKELQPNWQLWVSHSLEQGMYCLIEGQDKVDESIVVAIEKRMQELVAQGLPITLSQIAKDDAVNFFLAEGKKDKADLLALRKNSQLNLYTISTDKVKVSEYFFGRMIKNTALLNNFSLQAFDQGFVLNLPPRNFMGIAERRSYKVPYGMQDTLNEHHKWLQIQGISTISDLNKRVENNKFSELVLISEVMQERKLSLIADAIYANYPQVRLVLIAGPSSSGKTTFTRRLEIQLQALGIKPISISMDDYFHDRDKTPLDADGKPDYEGVAAMELDLFNRQLAALIAGQEVVLPRYDFIAGKRAPEGKVCRLGENQIIIVEGIHALNESITQSIPKSKKRKIFVSALTQLNLDEYNPIATSDNRLLRRMARDMKFRGQTPANTLEHWELVRRGEHRNIFPYQEEADYFFNSALVYEIAVLRPALEEELQKISPDMPAYIEARRLLRFIQYFKPAQTECIPKNSILQEFLGESCFL